MTDLSTTYMGLKLRNPLVIGSCGITKDIKGVKKCADAGAGAIVLKSLFEEQIIKEMDWRMMDFQFSWHPEAFDFMNTMPLELGPMEYLDLIKEAKDNINVPIIASLNCVSSKWWPKYARQIEAAGADALELNISYMPRDPERRCEEIERHYFLIVEEIKRSISIPWAVKIGPYFTSLANMAVEICRRGASALVLFNRFYQFDIDIEKEEPGRGYPFSSAEESNLPLRWTALLSGTVNCDIASSTGIHDAPGAIKHLLAGASVFQVASVLYTSGIESAGKILSGIETWMKDKGYRELSEFRGKASQRQSERPELYERLQYIKALVGIE